jgi:hypothetical protein
VRGLTAPLAIRVIESAATLAHYEPPHVSSETDSTPPLAILHQ